MHKAQAKLKQLLSSIGVSIKMLMTSFSDINVTRPLKILKSLWPT